MVGQPVLIFTFFSRSSVSWAAPSSRSPCPPPHALIAPLHALYHAQDPACPPAAIALAPQGPAGQGRDFPAAALRPFTKQAQFRFAFGHRRQILMVAQPVVELVPGCQPTKTDSRSPWRPTTRLCAPQSEVVFPQPPYQQLEPLE